ncbi:LCP family protein [Streptomyces sp. CA-142005]|uniref:LCP family protein n=1 Tax=Streptomyces sp. CA-142005 TaxID=3240052 RepID=UPI003D93EE7A
MIRTAGQLIIPGPLDPGTGKHHRPAKNKLNAAYSVGGRGCSCGRSSRTPDCSSTTFVGGVDARGGVAVCVGRTIKDDESGLDLSNGCHNLDGAQELAFVRPWHQEARGDLGRSRNRRKFLSALAHRPPSRARHSIRCAPSPC